MKNVRKMRFSLSTSSTDKKEKWIKHEVRAKAVKDHPDLFNLDDEVTQVRDKVRALEKKIVKHPRRSTIRNHREPDILPMEDDVRQESSAYEEANFELTLSEKSNLRRERIRQVLGTLLFVAFSLAFGLWALNFLLARIG